MPICKVRRSAFIENANLTVARAGALSRYCQRELLPDIDNVIDASNKLDMTYRKTNWIQCL